MCKIKICGITREEDIEALNIYRPEYAGFVFAKSRRRISPHECIKLSVHLDSQIKKVGVFVNEDIEKIYEIAKYCNLDVLQLHGDEDEEYVYFLRKLFENRKDNISGIIRNIDIWKHLSIPVKETKINKEESINQIEQKLNIVLKSGIDAVLFDTYFNGERGGTGKTFDWSILFGKVLNNNTILAGGLDEKNVIKAIRAFNPWAVDVSSGVETNGFKDKHKIRDFIAAIRNYE